MALLLYRDIAAKIPYTGGLLLGNDWANDDHSLPRYHHSACYYFDVREVILHEGRATHEYNHSSEIAVIRERAREMAKGEVNNQREQISEQVKRCFVGEYDYHY